MSKARVAYDEQVPPDRSGYQILFCTSVYSEISGYAISPMGQVTIYCKEPLLVTLTFEKSMGERAWIQSLANLNKTSSKSGFDDVFEVSKMIMMHYNFKKIDQMSLESINEKSLLVEDILVTVVRPLVINYGFFFMTNLNIYIQSITTKDNMVERIRLKSINRILKRRYNLRNRGIELFYHESESIFISFDNTEIRNQVYELVCSKNLECITEKNLSIEQVTEKWRERQISNFEYLQELNQFAHRSFNDLSQYPVYPWVLAQYNQEELDLNDEENYRDLSVPIGALNSDRLSDFVERYKQMSEPKYMYGTHYSSPFYVVGYLVRKYPLYMLHLNNGKFERSDRIFNSIEEDWKVRLAQSALQHEQLDRQRTDS